MWKKIVFIAGFLLIGSASAGKKLPVKTIEVMDDGSVREILESVGQGMTRSGGGQIVRRTVPKIPGKIPWGGTMAWGPVLITAALEAFYKSAQSSLGPNVDRWWKHGEAGFPVPVPYQGGTAYPFNPDGEIVCQGYDSKGAPVSVYIGRRDSPGYTPDYMALYSVKTADGATRASVISYGFEAQSKYRESVLAWANEFCKGLTTAPQTLGEIMQRHPNEAQSVTNTVRDFMRSNPDHPSVKQMFLVPAPTINQWNDELIDPFIVSVPGSKYSDGDYLQEGIEPTSGNRPHPLDGGPLVPWIDSPTPVDTDNDGVPDWRDSDDDGDGFNDDEEPDWQKEKEKTPVTELDTDKDGIPDYQDEDDDGDGWSDREEEAAGTDKKNPDSKPDDTDNDGTPDHQDDDDDGDGWSDRQEDEAGTNKKDPASTPTDTDRDGTPDHTDPDDDGDGFSDEEEEEAGSDKNDPKSTPDDKDGDGKDDEEEPCAEVGVASDDGSCGPGSEEDDGPAGQPAFEAPPLDKWDSSPISEALEEAKNRIREAQSKKLPFAVAEMFPKLGGVGSTCPHINVVTGNRQMGNVQLEICQSAPSQWMHTTGRSVLEFVLTVMALLTAGRLVMNA